MPGTCSAPSATSKYGHVSFLIFFLKFLFFYPLNKWSNFFGSTCGKTWCPRYGRHKKHPVSTVQKLTLSPVSYLCDPTSFKSTTSQAAGPRVFDFGSLVPSTPPVAGPPPCRASTPVPPGKTVSGRHLFQPIFSPKKSRSKRRSPQVFFFKENKIIRYFFSKLDGNVRKSFEGERIWTTHVWKHHHMATMDVYLHKCL